jgi:hypothetical protein
MVDMAMNNTIKGGGSCARYLVIYINNTVLQVQGTQKS